MRTLRKLRIACCCSLAGVTGFEKDAISSASVRQWAILLKELQAEELFSPVQASRLYQFASLISRSWVVSDFVVASSSKVGQNRSCDQREGEVLRAGSFLEGQPTNRPSWKIVDGMRLAKMQQGSNARGGILFVICQMWAWI